MCFYLFLPTDMPMEQLPVLEVDGVKYGQASAICSYLARELGEDATQ